VYQKPATRFVLEFLGASNYLPAQVVGGDMVLVPDAADATLPLPEDNRDVPPGTPGQISFRVEDVTVERLGTEPSQWTGTITSAAFLGEAYEYDIRIGQSRIHIPGPKYDPLSEGTQVRVCIRPGSYAFWPAETAGGTGAQAPSRQVGTVA
jgi:iron(III) transport system ATP-binding protein